MTRPLWLVMVLAAGLGRAALVVGCAAGVTGFLLLAATFATAPSSLDTVGTLDDANTKLGVALAALLMSVPLLLLLDQSVALGSTARRRRQLALLLAGATGRDLRRWGALEVGLPGLLGAVLGLPVWWGLRWVLGDGLRETVGVGLAGVYGPGWLAVPVLLLVAMVSAYAGLRAASRAARGPRSTRAVRPWLGFALLVLCGVDLVAYGQDLRLVDVLVLPLAAPLLLVAALLALAPSLALGAAQLLRASSSSAPTMLAASRLAASPRSASRAAAAVGSGAVAAGVLPSFALDALEATSSGGDALYYLVPGGLVALCVVAVVLVVTVSVMVHSTETVLQRRRELAALVATGVPVDALERSQRVEGFLVTLPLILAAGTAGAVGYTVVSDGGLRHGLAGLAGVGLLAVLVGGSVVVASRVLRPWLDGVVTLDNLRQD